MTMTRRVLGVVSGALLLACHPKSGDWERSREQLCDEVELASQDVARKLPGFETSFASVSTNAETAYATWNDASCDRKILIARQRTELCMGVVREVTEEAADIRGLWKAAGAVATGRPDGVEAIGLGLADVRAPNPPDVCDGSREQYETQWKKALASIRTEWTDKLAHATDQCKAQGWQSKLPKDTGGRK